MLVKSKWGLDGMVFSLMKQTILNFLQPKKPFIQWVALQIFGDVPSGAQKISKMMQTGLL
jgi:hypothetical protein